MVFRRARNMRQFYFDIRYPVLDNPMFAIRISNYNQSMSKTRLDLLLVERGLAESRAKAQALIMAGQVRVDGQVVIKPATSFDLSAKLHLERGPRFVSRGGEKLDAALETFGLDVDGLLCADGGASTGGFTDCLLQRGAARVFAIDVTVDQLDWKLRQDKRVTTVECNARYLKADHIAERPSRVTMDVSFISVTKILPAVVPVAAAGA